MDNDRISRLPDELLLHILSFLPTKYAVSTSSLSKRWSNLYIPLPILDLKTHDNCGEYLYGQNWDTFSFVVIVNKLIVANTAPTISKFRLDTQDFEWKYLTYINSWISILLSKKVTELDLSVTLDEGDFDFEDEDEGFRLRLLPCDSLEVLKLSSNTCLDMPISDCCFRHLRVFHLAFRESQVYQELVATVFTNLPRLEELSIKARLWLLEEEITFNVVALVLKFFSFCIDCTDDTDYYEVKVVIDAPLLEKICLNEDQIASYSFKTRLSFKEAKVCLGNLLVVENYMDSDLNGHFNILKALEILQGVSNAKSLSLSGETVLALVISPQNDLPATPRLNRLELVIPCPSAWKLLLPLLSNAPNLEVLILSVREYNNKFEEVRILEQESSLVELIGEFQFVRPEFVPTCLYLNLKEIEIWGVEKIEEFKVLEYIVENAIFLKKLTVNPIISSMESMDGNVGVTRDGLLPTWPSDDL